MFTITGHRKYLLTTSILLSFGALRSLAGWLEQPNKTLLLKIVVGGQIHNSVDFLALLIGGMML
jgi:hypothetical protein